MDHSYLKAHNVDKIFKLENPTAPIRRSTKWVSYWWRLNCDNDIVMKVNMN